MELNMSEICGKDIFGDYHSHKCGKPAKFEVNGKHYCGIHNPNKAPTKSQIEAEENRKIQSAKWRLERAAPDLLEALQNLCRMAKDGDVPSWVVEWDSAREVIERATNDKE